MIANIIYNYIFGIAEAVTLGCSVKKELLKILQNLRENAFARVSFLIKLHAL